MTIGDPTPTMLKRKKWHICGRLVKFHTDSPQEAVHLLYGQLVVKDMFVVGRGEGGQMHAGSLKG